LEKIDMVCIVCPIGCNMTISEDTSEKSGFKVVGNKCSRGKNYAVKEMKKPTRMLTTTVTISHAFISRMPVKSSAPLPKELLGQAMAIINRVEVKAPVIAGEIIITNILGTGIDILASRSMKNVQ